MERCASQTEYAPKHHSLDKIIAAATVSPNASSGANTTTRAVNNAANALSLRCKLAELVNVGFAIAIPLSTYPKSFKMPRLEGTDGVQTFATFLFRRPRETNERSLSLKEVAILGGRLTSLKD